MTEEFTKLSSKGQVVIPQEIREDLHLEEGTPFLVVAQKNSILLKKIDIPKIKSWDEATKPFRVAAKKSNFSETDLENLIKEARGLKR
mgnify:CR=1 FL=1